MKEEGGGVRGRDMMMGAGAAAMEFLSWKMEEGHKPKNVGNLEKARMQILLESLQKKCSTLAPCETKVRFQTSETCNHCDGKLYVSASLGRGV